jgi:hypothetical protein
MPTDPNRPDPAPPPRSDLSQDYFDGIKRSGLYKGFIFPVLAVDKCAGGGGRGGPGTTLFRKPGPAVDKEQPP